MIIEVKIPTPGESISTVEIVQWLVTDGDIVTKNQELAEIESEKATLTLVSPSNGVIKILAKANQPIAVNSLACTIDDSIQDNNADVVSDAKPDVVESSKLHINNGNKIKDVPIITPLAKKIMEEHNLSAFDVIQRIGSKEILSILSNNDSDSIESQSTKFSENRKPMSNLRKKLSERLVATKNQTAMLTTFNEIDMSNLIEFRKNNQIKFQEMFQIKLGFMSFFTKAATIALKVFPVINSMVDGNDIVSFNYCDIGIAVQTPKGLMVPVVRHTDSKNISQLEHDIMVLAEKARKGTITLDELKGGTFTITNGGIFGSLLSTPIINPPQSAILGMHTIQERPVALKGQVVIRPMMYVALSYDHRLIDGRDSVGFLLKVKTLIENPYQMLTQSVDPDMELIGM